MKAKIILYFLFLFIFSSNIFGEENVWEDFIQEPNEINFIVCQQQIEESLFEDCEPYLSTTTVQLTEDCKIWKVLKLVENGNIYAIELCFQLYPLFIGYPNYLEFFDIYLGRLIEKDPELFLRLLDKYLGKSFHSLGGILCNYGEEFVDKFDEKIVETQKRVKALQKVQNKSLIKIRDQCIDVLIKEEIFLKEAIIEMSPDTTNQF